jgi:hypothetical protein
MFHRAGVDERGCALWQGQKPLDDSQVPLFVRCKSLQVTAFKVPHGHACTYQAKDKEDPKERLFKDARLLVLDADAPVHGFQLSVRDAVGRHRGQEAEAAGMGTEAGTDGQRFLTGDGGGRVARSGG